MSNEAEQKAFEAWWTRDAERTENKAAAFEGWQARAAYQREQDKKLVEALKGRRF